MGNAIGYQTLAIGDGYYKLSSGKTTDSLGEWLFDKEGFKKSINKNSIVYFKETKKTNIYISFNKAYGIRINNIDKNNKGVMNFSFGKYVKEKPIYISPELHKAISQVMEDFLNERN